MATVNTKSALVQAHDAHPKTPIDIKYFDGTQRKAVATVEAAAGDSNGSTYRMIPVYSGWSIDEIMLLNDAMGSGAAYHVGLYETAANGGGAVDADVYAASADVASAGADDVAFHTRDIADAAQAIWQDAGLSKDPNKWYDLVVTAATAGANAGTLTVRVRYTDGT